MQSAERSDLPLASRRPSTALSTLVVMAGSAFSVLMGFGREIATAHYYGTRPEVDAFLNASIIPTLLFGAFNSALVAALVPTLSDYIATGRRDDAVRLGSTIINALLIGMTLLAVVGWVIAPFLAPVIGRGFPPSEQALVVDIARWLMPGIIAISVGGVCSALLNSIHRFTAASLVWSAANAVTIVFVVFLNRELGIFALVAGTLLGMFGQIAIQAPSMFRNKLYLFRIDLQHEGLRRVFFTLIPVAIGSGASQVNLAFDRFFASTLPSGSTAVLNYTTKLAYLPNQVVAGAIATAAYPLLAGYFSTANREALRSSISVSARMVAFIVIPSAAALIAIAYPLVQTLFERGAFDSEATELCASLIPFACLPLLATSLSTLFGRACYACREVKLAVVFSSGCIILNVMLSTLFVPRLGAKGLLLANGLAGSVLLVLQGLLLSTLVQGLEWRLIIRTVVKASAASLGMAAVLVAIVHLTGSRIDQPLLRAIHLAFLILVAFASYMFACRLLQVDELDVLLRKARRIFRRAPKAVQ